MELATALRAVHAFVGAIWLGSVYFSLMVLHRQSPELFESNEEFERYVAGLSDGNRWRILSAVAATGVSGIALVALSAERLHDPLWASLMGVKLAALLATLGVFSYISWRLWPARIFALPSELPELQRKGTILRATMFGLISLNFLLGIAAHLL